MRAHSISSLFCPPISGRRRSPKKPSGRRPARRRRDGITARPFRSFSFLTIRPPTLTALSQTARPDQPRRGTVRKLIKPIFRIAELGRPRLARGRYGDPGPRQAVEETKLSGNTRGVGSIADYLLHPRRLESPLSCRLFPRLHTDRKYHAEGGAVPERRLKDDPPSVHLHNALSNGQPKASTPLLPRVRTIDLLKLIEDQGLISLSNASTGIAHRHDELPILDPGIDFHRALVGELDGVSNEVQQNLCETPFVAASRR